MESLDERFFDGIQVALDLEILTRERISERVKDLERTCRSLQGNLMKAHACVDSFDDVITKIASMRQELLAISNVIPNQKFYRYNHSFCYTLQNACFLCAFWVFLTTDTLITPRQLETMLGVPVNIHNDLTTFHIPLEDFLHGLVSLPSELSRLAINLCTVGKYQHVLVIKQFVQNVYIGFQLLNLKNDSLRKRYDGIKYEVRKLEEIVYDIQLRKLLIKPA